MRNVRRFFFRRAQFLARTARLVANDGVKPDFKTQIFWLGMKALHCFLLPSMKEAEIAYQCAGPT